MIRTANGQNCADALEILNLNTPEMVFGSTNRQMLISGIALSAMQPAAVSGVTSATM